MQMKCNFPLLLIRTRNECTGKKNCIFCKWKIVDWNDNTIKALMQQKLFNSPATVTTMAKRPGFESASEWVNEGEREWFGDGRKGNWGACDF